VERAVVDLLPAGDPAFVSVIELARASGYTRIRIYQLIRAGRGPALQPRKGIAFADAVAWLKSNSRDARKAASDARVKRLRLAGAAEEARRAREAT
jgi:hypothetical protein